MTATRNKPALPDFNGEPVHRTAIKFTGVGTGFNGIDVRPVVMAFDEEAYFVVRVKAAESASHLRDKHGQLIRLQRVRAEDMAPIDRATAEQALQSYAAEIKRQRDEIDGQLALDAEAEAEQREAEDETAPADEIAAKAAERAKRP